MMTIEIADKDFTCLEEWYGPTFKCPKCGEDAIRSRFKYCPMCSIELIHTHRVSIGHDDEDSIV